MFSYWQQEQSCKWLVLYASDLKGGCIVHKASTIDCSDDANIVLLSKKDKSIKLYRDANTASAKYEAWKETYGRQIHDDLIFSKDSVAYQIGVKPLRKKDLRDFTPDDKIVNKFEEILRHNNVSDKENAFNRLVALFICKLVDESIKDEDDEGTEGDTGTGDTEDEDDESIGMIQAIGDIALPAVRPVTESAIHTTKFVQLDGTDHKIAYLAYNTFTAGTAENSEAYNNELRAFSQQCQQFGINNFILDLRYNPGGEMECVQLLADMLVPADKLESPFAFLQYNDKQSNRNHDLILDSQLLQGGANLNLSKVYIITGGTTAGAAEMLINCLKPYMTVVLIGQTTKGENVATETFINPKYPWAVRPVVCEVFNANGEADYSTGFKPDLSINETSYLQYYLPLGDFNEILFNTAMGIIAGAIELPEAQTRETSVKSFATPKNIRKGLIIK